MRKSSPVIGPSFLVLASRFSLLRSPFLPPASSQLLSRSTVLLASTSLLPLLSFSCVPAFIFSSSHASNSYQESIAHRRGIVSRYWGDQHSPQNPPKAYTFNKGAAVLRIRRIRGIWFLSLRAKRKIVHNQALIMHLTNLVSPNQSTPPFDVSTIRALYCFSP